MLEWRALSLLQACVADPEHERPPPGAKTPGPRTLAHAAACGFAQCAPGTVADKGDDLARSVAGRATSSAGGSLVLPSRRRPDLAAHRPPRPPSSAVLFAK